MPKFSASAAVAPARPAKKASVEESGASASSQIATRTGRSVPKASDVVLIEQGPRPQRAPARLPTSAPVTVCVYLVTENAADVWPLYEGTQVSLWQIQVAHPARPSILYDMVSSFNDYLKKTRTEDDSVPGSLADLTSQCGCKLVIADSSDPENVGFVQWRSAWYVAGEAR